MGEDSAPTDAMQKQDTCEARKQHTLCSAESCQWTACPFPLAQQDGKEKKIWIGGSVRMHGTD